MSQRCNVRVQARLRGHIRLRVATRSAHKSRVKVRFQTASSMFVLLRCRLLRLHVLSILAKLLLARVGCHMGHQGLLDGAARVVHARLGSPRVGSHCVGGASLHESCD